MNVLDKQNKLTKLLCIFLISILATLICYHIYYLLAPWIWSKNIKYSPGVVLPWISCWQFQKDGIEIYALYIMIFISILIALILSSFVEKNIKKTSSILYIVLFFSLFYFYYTIGFKMPVADYTWNFLALIKTFVLIIGCFSVIFILFYLDIKKKVFFNILITMILAWSCFFDLESFNWCDYEYIFAPALSLMKNHAINEIYFQYDVLLSFFALIWMKLNLDLNYFQLLGLISYFIVILSLFFISKKLFYNKKLPVFLLISLILFRLYTSWHLVGAFQITPLRLDLWILLFFSIYYKGVYHWLSALICGFLIIFHHNFGVIYSLAYLQLLGILLIFDIIDIKNIKFKELIIKHFKISSVSIFLIIASYIIFFFLFKHKFQNSSQYYQSLGIGFIKISKSSFYWYVPIVLNFLAILLFRFRKNISKKYLSLGIFLILCTIGNSIYFFGRSHEHNIINIAIILVFVVFFLFDFVGKILSDTTSQTGFRLIQNHISLFLATIMIIVGIFAYSNRIEGKLLVQFNNVIHGNFILIDNVKYDAAILKYNQYENNAILSTNSIKEIINNSPKVYFIMDADFGYYYYGGYSPVGYYNPFKTWIFTKEFNDFLQDLLNQEYYIFYSKKYAFWIENMKLNFKEKIRFNDHVTILNGIQNKNSNSYK